MSIPQPKWWDLPTPNTSKRKRNIGLIVLHHSGGTKEGDLSWLRDSKSRVSADFYIDKTGRIYKLNPQLTQLCTWHAGKSFWNGITGVNEVSIGIEMEHKPGETWTDAQVKSCADLCAWLLDRYDLDLDDHLIQGHAAVAVPKGRKTDPESFPWISFGKEVRKILYNDK